MKILVGREGGGGRRLSNMYLLLAEDEVVELLLQNLVGVVDQKLLVEVFGENLEAENVQQADKHATRVEIRRSSGNDLPPPSSPSSIGGGAHLRC